MKISDKFILKTIDDESMLVPVNHDYMSVQKIINLNETSLAIYEMVKEGLDEKQIISKMLETYDVSEDVLKSDVTRVLKQFIELGVINE